MRVRTVIRRSGIVLVGLFVLIQFVPYGRAHLNPPVTREPVWDRPETRAIARRACFDCHSNETTWPWYSQVAPISWFVQRHVDHGRRALNFSEWHRPQDEAHEAAEAVVEREMPPRGYEIAHGRLARDEQQALARGLAASVEIERPHPRGAGGVSGFGMSE
jgi:hypothetical protein